MELFLLHFVSSFFLTQQKFGNEKSAEPSSSAPPREVTKSLIQTVMGLLGLCIIDPLYGIDQGLLGSQVRQVRSTKMAMSGLPGLPRWMDVDTPG